MYYQKEDKTVPLELFHLHLVCQYVDSRTDIINVMMTCKKYRTLNERYSYNPVPIRSWMNAIELFPYIQTFCIYNVSVEYEIDKCDQYLKAFKRVKFYNLKFDQILELLKQKWFVFTYVRNEKVMVYMKDYSDGDVEKRMNFDDLLYVSYSRKKQKDGTMRYSIKFE